VCQGFLIIEMETCEWPSVWKIIEDQDWDALEAYAEQNPEVILAKDGEFSVSAEVTKRMIRSPEQATSKPIESRRRRRSARSEKRKNNGGSIGRGY